MPINSPNYRPWSARRATINSRLAVSKRWWAICVTGILRAMKSRWVRRMMFTALLPLLFFGIIIFAFEQSKREPQYLLGLSRLLRAMPHASLLTQRVGQLPINPTAEQLDELRGPVWSYVLLTFLSYPQSLLMVAIVGIVAPPLISQDLRTRAYLIYFARPITKWEYVAGKFGVVAFFLFAISWLPSMLLYIAAVLLSPSLDVVLVTWDLPLRLFAASCCMVIPTTLVALAYSSLTLETRYAGFAWFATWILGHVTYSALIAIPTIEAAEDEQFYTPGWRLLTSPYQVLRLAQSRIMGFDSIVGIDAWVAFVWLGLATALSIWILFRRVDAPMRA